MLNFRQIQISDKDWVTELMNISDFRSCEYTFANNLAWRRLSDSVISRHKDFYVVASFNGKDPVFTYPCGKGDLEELFSELSKTARSSGGDKLIVSSVNNEALSSLKDMYGESMTVSANRDYFDYIYNANDLIDMAGKKFHGKRNHIRRFKETDWEYCELTEDMFADCIEFAANSYNANKGYDSFSAVCEQFAINTYFNYYRELELKGGVLKSDGKIVGFTIGERLNSDTFVVHIEKAVPELNGAYPTLCNEFAKRNAAGFRYINREEDMGIEGLRKSKLSYNPVFLQEKYTVSIDLERSNL